MRICTFAVTTAALILVVSLLGCTERNADSSASTSIEGKVGSADHVSFISKHAAFEFSFPLGWYVNPKDNPYDLQCYSPLQDMNTGVFAFKKADVDMTPIDTFWTQVTDMKSKRTNFEELEPLQKRDYDDKTVTSIAYRGDKDSSQFCYRFALIEPRADSSKYAVAIQVAKPELWDKCKAVLEDITRSARPMPDRD